MSRLIEIDQFSPVFGDLKGKKVGVVDGEGNTGDRLIYAATRQLLMCFGVQWQTVSVLYDPPEHYKDLDLLLIFSGGSMGGWRPCKILRQKALESGVPCRLLPQSWLAPEPGNYEKVFVREKDSLAHCPSAEFAPDLALGYNFPDTVHAPTMKNGYLLKQEGLCLFKDFKAPGILPSDPAMTTYTPMDYINTASMYEHIITDRLHFAIVGLGIGRKVTLLPYGYHKNWGLWKDWLRNLGCHWANHPREVTR